MWYLTLSKTFLSITISIYVIKIKITTWYCTIRLWKKRTFFMSAEELQLFLLLPPQCVDYGDGQSQCFFGVTMWSQCIHSGAGSRDVLCSMEGRKVKKKNRHEKINKTFKEINKTFVIPLGPNCLLPCQRGQPRVSNRGLSFLLW